MRRVAEVAGLFLRLGVTSFGGPAAHVGYFHRACVERRGWVSEAEFADLIALTQFLPGPGSSQLAFAIGRKRAGWVGALTASLSFLLPSAVLMIGFGYVLRRLSFAAIPPWVQGLKAAAVAVVAQAVILMARRLCRGWIQAALAIATAAAVLAVNRPGTAPAAIAIAALIGAGLLRPPISDRQPVAPQPVRPGPAAMLPFAIWALLLLILLPFAHRGGPVGMMPLAARFYRSGSLVFGGGHVVLPLLRAELVPTGWTSDSLFLAAYAGAQALPGPLFSLAACLGTLVAPHGHAWAYGLFALLGIFTPGWLLIAGALPWWDAVRQSERLRASVAGANASVVGLLAAALWRPVATSGLHRPADFAIAVAAFAALQLPRVPVWAIIAAAAGAAALAR